MTELRPLNRLKRARPSSLLGLALDGSRLEGVVLRRTNGSLHVHHAFAVNLTLDPLTNDPELVGREIRNHLQAAGVRERRCVVGLPLRWALTTHIKVPKLPEADVENFLALEAERTLPCDVHSLLLSSSRCQAPSGEQHATLVGIPRNQVALLEQALHAAKLKPISLSIGIAALEATPTPSVDGVLALSIGESQVGLQVMCFGGIMALRTLEGVLTIQGTQRELDSDAMAREARITLGQLPDECLNAITEVHVFGPPDLAERLTLDLRPRFEPGGRRVTWVTSYPPNAFGVQLPAQAKVSAAFSLAAGLLTERATPLEFLPPKITPWQLVAQRYASGKMRLVLAPAAAILLLGAGVFGVQQWQLARLRSQWGAIKTTAVELEGLQEKIRQYRPWFDDSARILTILRRLTEAFPEDGTVTAKVLEIHDPGTVTCSGVTRNNQALLKTIERLRSTPGVPDVNLGPTRGQAPTIQFTFTFNYEPAEGGNRAN